MLTDNKTQVAGSIAYKEIIRKMCSQRPNTFDLQTPISKSGQSQQPSQQARRSKCFSFKIFLSLFISESFFQSACLSDCLPLLLLDVLCIASHFVCREKEIYAEKASFSNL